MASWGRDISSELRANPSNFNVLMKTPLFLVEKNYEKLTHQKKQKWKIKRISESSVSVENLTFLSFWNSCDQRRWESWDIEWNKQNRHLMIFKRRCCNTSLSKLSFFSKILPHLNFAYIELKHFNWLISSAFPKNFKNSDLVGWVLLKNRQINLENRHSPVKHPTIEKNFREVFYFYCDTVLNTMIWFKHSFLSSTKIFTINFGKVSSYVNLNILIIVETLWSSSSLMSETFKKKKIYFYTLAQAIRIPLSKFPSSR